MNRWPPLPQILQNQFGNQSLLASNKCRTTQSSPAQIARNSSASTEAAALSQLFRRPSYVQRQRYSSPYQRLGWFSKRTGTSLHNGARCTNTQIWSNKNRIQTIPRSFTSSSQVPVLLLNQPILSRRPTSTTTSNRPSGANNSRTGPQCFLLITECSLTIVPWLIRGNFP